MMDLLRMDLRRMTRSKLFIILPAVMTVLLAITYLMVAAVASPEVLAGMQAQGAEITADDRAESAILLSYTTLEFLQQTLFNGGFWLVTIGLGAGLFAVSDHTSGYDKNIFSVMGARWPYVAARAVSLLALTAVTLGVGFLVTLIVQPLLIFETVGGTAGDWLLMYGQGVIVGWAFCMAMQCCAVVFRRGSWMVAAAFAGGCGLFPALLDLFCRVLHLPQLAAFMVFPVSQLQYTAFYPIGVAVCLAWGAVYLVLATLLLEKRDIA